MPKVSATYVLVSYLNTRYIPEITEDELVKAFKEHSIPQELQYRYGEMFYEFSRWGLGRLERFMAEHDLTKDDVMQTFASMKEVWQSDAFRVLSDDLR